MQLFLRLSTLMLVVTATGFAQFPPCKFGQSSIVSHDQGITEQTVRLWNLLVSRRQGFSFPIVTFLWPGLSSLIQRFGATRQVLTWRSSLRLWRCVHHA